MMQKKTYDPPSRRDFLREMTLSGIGLLGLSTFFQSCAEKGIVPSSDLAKTYVEKILDIIVKIRERELPKILKASTVAVQARLQGHQLYSHMTGEMIYGETTPDRPGSPHIFFTENINRASREDVVLTNDPLAARGLGEQYIKVIGITTPNVPNFSTPPGVLQNMGVLRIEDVADIVIHCHVPYTDGILNVEGIEVPVCPASGIIHSLIYYSLAAEIVEGLAKSGIYPQIGSGKTSDPTET